MLRALQLNPPAQCDLSVLAALPLCRLSLMDCQNLSLQALRKLPPLPHLTELTLRNYYDLTNAGLQKLLRLPALRKLYLLDTFTTHRGWRRLRALPLRYFYFNYTKPSATRTFQSVLESCDWLTAHMDGVVDPDCVAQLLECAEYEMGRRHLDSDSAAALTL
eukprot:gb/GEZN01013409.1/.p1 GENE.gb/GEZN01013409.1/~~gb/GEZN01013409.1/.p1  ORF type:complete len:162 (-),score=20.18 gb/GEZN01013409.1/:36-521(-)